MLYQDITYLNRYGATETVCISTRTLKGDPTSSGTVGPPQPACELKLVDMPSLGYTSEDKPNPRGELYCRGLNVMKGYYKGSLNLFRYFVMH